MICHCPPQPPAPLRTGNDSGLWYENFPRTLVEVEAFACGLPVIASRLGAMAELIRDGESGLLFEPGNPADLAEKVAWVQAHPDAMRAMGEAARREYWRSTRRR